MSQRGLWSYPRLPISDQAIYKRLQWMEIGKPLARTVIDSTQCLNKDYFFGAMIDF